MYPITFAPFKTRIDAADAIVYCHFLLARRKVRLYLNERVLKYLSNKALMNLLRVAGRRRLKELGLGS